MVEQWKAAVPKIRQIVEIEAQSERNIQILLKEYTQEDVSCG